MAQLGAPDPTSASTPTQQTPLWQHLMPALCQPLELHVGSPKALIVSCLFDFAWALFPPICVAGKPLLIPQVSPHVSPVLRGCL